MIIELEGKTINLNSKKNCFLGNVLLKIIETKHCKRFEIAEYIFSSYKKMKLDTNITDENKNNTTFLDYIIKHNDEELIKEYDKYLCIFSKNYNIIHSCVSANNVELLKKYINDDNVHPKLQLDQIIDGKNPLTIAIKNDNWECFENLIDAGATTDFSCDPDNEIRPLTFLLNEIKQDVVSGKQESENKRKMLMKLLPIEFDNDILEQSINPEDISNKKDIRELISQTYTSIDETIENYEQNEEKYKLGYMLDDVLDYDSNYSGDSDDIDSDDSINSYTNSTDTDSTDTDSTNDLVDLMDDNLLDLMVDNHIIFSSEEIRLFLMIMGEKCEISNDIVNMIVNMRPNILLTIYYEETILSYVCVKGTDAMINNILNNHIILFKHSIESIHQLISTNKILFAKQIFMKYPELMYKLNEDKRTYYDSVILSSSISLYDKIELIEQLHKQNVNINNINKFDCRPINIAIQYECMDVVKKVAEYSSKKVYSSCPYASCAIHNNLDAFKILEEFKFKYDIVKIDDIAVPKCLYGCMKTNNYEMIKHILASSIFKITETQKQCVYNIFKKGHEKCDDIVLNLLNKNHVIRESHKIDDELRTLDGQLRLLFSQYSEHKIDFLRIFKTVIIVLLKILENDIGKASRKNFYSTEILTLKKLSAEEFGYISVIISKYLTNFKESARSISELIINLITAPPNKDEIYTIQLLFRSYIDDFKKISSIIDNLFKAVVVQEDEEIDIKNDSFTFPDTQNDKLENEDITNAVNFLKNNKNKIVPAVVKEKNIKLYLVKTQTHEFIESLVAGLNYPILLENYETIKNNLLEKFEICENNYCYRIMQNDKTIIILNKNNGFNKLFGDWFSQYGYNICIKQKRDLDHMFSFSLDLLLYDLYVNKRNGLKCDFYKRDKVSYLYFYGKMLQNDIMIYGRFEYYIDTNQILFHRMFRPKKQN